MSDTASNVRLFGTGAVYVDPTVAAAAPTSSSSVLDAAFVDMGYASQDGSPSLTIPVASDKTVVRGWQNNDAVRVIRTPGDDLPQLQVTLMETNLVVIEESFGVTVTQSAADGSFVFNANAQRLSKPLVFDGIDGAELCRYYAPKAVVTAVDAIKLSGTDITVYTITWDFELDDDLDGNFQSWSTALKTVA